MKAMIFAAGIGSRLKPFTDHHPKALAKVCGVPMLQRVILKLRDAGADRMVVNTHHFAGQIIDFLNHNGNFGVDIVISDESDLLLDTGGGLLRAEKLLQAADDEPIVLHNADILTDAPVDAMTEAHIASGADATLLASDRPSSRRLYFDDGGRLRGWRDERNGECRPEGFNQYVADACQPLAFDGVHVVNRSIFPHLREYAEDHGAVFSITPFYLAIARELNIRAYTPPTPFTWHDIGTPEKLARAEVALSRLR